ncbi:hypothetical protein D1007_15622 [Hordeum vulgare]|nr:hypothetical protein D1007_15622 [Hordeum vulgare]
MALRAAADNEQPFTMHAVVDTHRRFAEPSVVYTNNPVWVEYSIHIMELSLAEQKYKICMRNRVLMYHYYLATRPCKHFVEFVNSPRYMFAMVDITNDIKVLKNSSITCQNLVDIEGQYKIWGRKKHERDSLVHLTDAIIAPYYRDMKDSSNKDKHA